MRITGKKARTYVARYNATQPYRDLYSCYKDPSRAKIAAWGRCILAAAEMNGLRPVVLSYNCQNFTAAWEYTHPDTGVRMLHVETAYNSYDMEM